MAKKVSQKQEWYRLDGVHISTARKHFEYEFEHHYSHAVKNTPNRSYDVYLFPPKSEEAKEWQLAEIERYRNYWGKCYRFLILPKDDKKPKETEQ